MAKLTDLQIGYLAGIIDGEGSMGLYNCQGRTHMKPWCTLNNTDLDMLETIQSWVGGNIRALKLREGRKLAYELGFGRQVAILELLRLIEPFLISKKPQAQLLMAWCLWRQSGGSDTHEEEIFASLKEFNKRGGL